MCINGVVLSMINNNCPLKTGVIKYVRYGTIENGIYAAAFGGGYVNAIVVNFYVGQQRVGVGTKMLGDDAFGNGPGQFAFVLGKLCR